MSMPDDQYEANLHHMAEPAAPSERESAVSITLEDYQALYLGSALREWAGYLVTDEEKQSIALGYAAYIDRQVRRNEQHTVDVYAHTEEAARTICEAAEEWETAYDETNTHHESLFGVVFDCLGDLWAQRNAEEFNKDVGRNVYEEPTDDDSAVDVEATASDVEQSAD